MRRLIEDMIMLVQLESHRFDGSIEPTEMAEAVEACVRRHAEAAAQASMSLDAQANRGLVVAVPPRLVDAVLDNLVENAIRHAGEGERVELRVRGLSGAVELVVHDTRRPDPARAPRPRVRALPPGRGRPLGPRARASAWRS